MVATADAVVAAVCLLSAALVAVVSQRVRQGETSLISGYSPGDLPPERERVLARRTSLVGFASAAYTGVGAPLAVMSVPDTVWLWWTVGFLALLLLVSMSLRGV